MRDLLRLLLDVEDYYNNKALPLLNEVVVSPTTAAFGAFVALNVLLLCMGGLLALGGQLRAWVRVGVAFQWKVARVAAWPLLAGTLAWVASRYWSNSTESASW